LEVPKFFHSKMMEATVFLGTFIAADIVLVPFSRPVPQNNPVSELYRQFL
jgi:hypothetical protein